jgi:hypothetical protein
VFQVLIHSITPASCPTLLASLPAIPSPGGNGEIKTQQPNQDPNKRRYENLNV